MAEIPPDNRSAWNAISTAYQARYRMPPDRLMWGPWCPDESKLGLLGDISGKRVLVLGCGGGQDCVALKKMGASEVTGIDLSDEQIAYAKRLASQEGVSVMLRQGTVEDLSGIDSESADLAVSSCALDYVERIDRCFAEAYRVLIPGGLLALSVMHPTSGVTSESPPYGFESSYFREIEDWPWEFSEANVKASFRSYRRTVSGWFQQLRDAGFQVERLLEPEPDEATVKTGWEETFAIDKARVIPTVVIFLARKPGGGR